MHSSIQQKSYAKEIFVNDPRLQNFSWKSSTDNFRHDATQQGSIFRPGGWIIQSVSRRKCWLPAGVGSRWLCGLGNTQRDEICRKAMADTKVDIILCASVTWEKKSAFAVDTWKRNMNTKGGSAEGRTARLLEINQPGLISLFHM